MLQIFQQQVSKRWDVLPDNLKEALFSESNASIVWQIGTLNHLSEEKISIMATIVGDVIFGFLHSEDLAREIQNTINLNPQIANSISREINRKIFAPLRNDLEKNYSPETAISEIKPEIPKEEIRAEAIKLPPGAPLQPIEIESSKPAELPIADTKTKLPDFEPVMPSDSIPTDKPFIIHQETGAQQVTEKKKVVMPAIGWFKKAIPAGRQEKPKMPESPIKVQLETFGPKIEERKEPITAKTETPKQRIVHYREVEIPTPFGKAQGEPFGRPGTQPPKETQPSKIETPSVKSETPKSYIPGKPFGTAPFGKAQGGQGGPKQPTKPIEPKVIDLESFFEVTEKKENGTKNEVGLEGNTINLKDNKK